jgi:hypothetical protein
MVYLTVASTMSDAWLWLRLLFEHIIVDYVQAKSYANNFKWKGLPKSEDD